MGPKAIVSFGAVFAEARVDPEFGTVRLSRMVVAYDAGRIINPKTARSQAIGGIIWGVGHALLEQSETDPATGRFVNRNYSRYLVPTNADIPELEILFVGQYAICRSRSKSCCEAGRAREPKENAHVETGTLRNPDSRQRLIRCPELQLGSDMHHRQLQPGAIRRMSVHCSREYTLIGPLQTDGADSVRADKQRRVSWKRFEIAISLPTAA
jgi:Molybdopterin-binding domain of aldehyde dehydrogenase